MASKTADALKLIREDGPWTCVVAALGTSKAIVTVDYHSQMWLWIECFDVMFAPFFTTDKLSYHNNSAVYTTQQSNFLFDDVNADHSTLIATAKALHKGVTVIVYSYTACRKPAMKDACEVQGNVCSLERLTFLFETFFFARRPRVRTPCCAVATD